LLLDCIEAIGTNVIGPVTVGVLWDRAAAPVSARERSADGAPT